MLFRRATQQIIQDLQFFPVVGIIGPRQVGKTTLAKFILNQLSPAKAAPGGFQPIAFQANAFQIKSQMLYLDLELDTDRRKLHDAQTYLTYHQDKCIVIDEVQRMPELFPLLRALVDMDRRPARFILLGSATPEIIKGTSETLAGRIAYTELAPFSWLEAAGSATMLRHWLLGGFPASILASKISYAERWLQSFIESFIYRDLQELGHEISPQLVTRLLEMIASLHGNLLNQADLARSVGTSQPTVKRYLDLLEGSFMIERLQPYFVNISKRLVKQPKIYIRDSGILHYLLGIRSMDALLGHIAVGASWEGYVIEQIRRVTLNKNYRFYFYRTHKGAECDLILITPDGKRICIEIKRSVNQTLSRGFYEVQKDITPEQSFVIVPDGETYPTKDNIWICGLNEFLTDRLPKL